jgi:hypothetical protein
MFQLSNRFIYIAGLIYVKIKRTGHHIDRRGYWYYFKTFFMKYKSFVFCFLFLSLSFYGISQVDSTGLNNVFGKKGTVQERFTKSLTQN